MRRAVAGIVLTILSLLGSAGVFASPAYAYPVTAYGPYYEYMGHSGGSFTWYNRSVGVQGYVTDYAGGPSTQVLFDFWQGNVYLGTQTRTVTSGSRSFNWTQEGPPGGITEIDIWLCDSVGCYYEGTKYRP